MTNKSVSARIIAVCLVLIMSMALFVPVATLSTLAEASADYENTLSDISQMAGDGWKESYSEDPQGGVGFSNVAVGTYFKNQDSGIIRNENGFDWGYNNSYGNWRNPFKKMAALTYAGEQFEYFTLEIDYNVFNPGVPWPIVTFGQQSETAAIFYQPVNQVSNPAGDDSAIGVYPETEGTVNIFGKNVTGTRQEAPDEDRFTEQNKWHHMTVTVIPNMVMVQIDGLESVSTELNSSYNGGYIALMLGHSYSLFRNLKITKLTGFDMPDYENSLSDVSKLGGDGWKESYSENPQGGVDFSPVSVGTYFKNQDSGIIRNENGFDWGYNNSYGNWRNPFKKMAALTYTGESFKYFTLEIDYNIFNPGVPWPMVTFGQQNKNAASIFYWPANEVPNPAGDGSAIGVYPEIEGTVNIAGKNVSARRQELPEEDRFTERNQWHHMTLTVIPGSVIVKIDDLDSVVTSLSDKYDGGYIALMLGHSYSMFRNIKITGYEQVDLSQKNGSPETELLLKNGEHAQHLVVTANPARGQCLDTLTAMLPSGTPVETVLVSSGVYTVKMPDSDITLKATYKAKDAAYYENPLLNLAQMEKDDWISTYSRAYGEPVQELTGGDFSKYWAISDEWLVRCIVQGEGITDPLNGSIDFTGAQPRTEQIAAMTYVGNKYRDFELKVNINNTNYPRTVRPEITFGGETPGSIHCDENGVGDAGTVGVFIDGSGYVHVEGDLVTGQTVFPGTFNTTGRYTVKIKVQKNLVAVYVNNVYVGYSILSGEYDGGYVSLVSASTYGYYRDFSLAVLADGTNDSMVLETLDYNKKVTIDLASSEESVYLPQLIDVVTKAGNSYMCPVEWKQPDDYKPNIGGNFVFTATPLTEILDMTNPQNLSARIDLTQKIDYDPSTSVKYYFNSQQELSDFTATYSPQAKTTAFEVVDTDERWIVSEGLLAHPSVEIEGEYYDNGCDDYNYLTLTTHKFRNFELTVSYKTGYKKWWAGIAFGQSRPGLFFNTENGGIGCFAETEGKAVMWGDDLLNRNNNDMLYPWSPQVVNYDRNAFHTMRLLVVEGTVEMYIDDMKKPLTGVLPNDYSGYISLAVGDNTAYYNNLTVQPLDCWGNPITLAENDASESFEGGDTESAVWTGDNSEWGEQPTGYIYTDGEEDFNGFAGGVTSGMDYPSTGDVASAVGESVVIMLASLIFVITISARRRRKATKT